MVDAAISFAVKLAEYPIEPVLRQVEYLYFYNSNIQELKDKVFDLEGKNERLTQRVESAKNNDERITPDVLSWMEKVNKFTKKAHDHLERVSGYEKSCLFNRCTNLKSRHQLSRTAKKKTTVADKLVLVEGTFERVSYPRPPVRELPLTTSHQIFETRSSTKTQIKEALKDKDIRIIGICGMCGVGKTMLAKEIVCDGEVGKLFEDIAFAVVSNDPDTKKIQDQLAEMLGLKFDENTIGGRAGRLRRRLQSKDRNSILVILDDVWKEINLEDIGIPPPHDRLKLMFTTRIKDTCSELGAQKKFEIEVLSEEEGLKLFKNTTGISDDETDGELMSIATKVVDECRGLPLALVSVGKALKSNKAVHKWRDTLRQLQSSATNIEGMDNIVYKNIRLSYKNLVSNEERDLLLLCSLFAEDESIPIENLVRYARGLKLFKEIETLYQTRDRAKTIVDNLKGCYLLQPGKEGDEVKLHDFIRDFCVQMAYEDKRGYMVKHAGLIEWPEHDANESYSAISITFDKLDKLQSGLKYPNVELLRVICRDLVKWDITEEFFKDMKELRVLELQRMYIQIPSSIELLTGLRTLCFIHCQIHSQLSMIGSLKKLEILSFIDSSYYSPIEFEFMNLCNLLSLDLRFRKLYCHFQPGVLSGMKKLEELYLGPESPDESIEREDVKLLSELDENGFINLKTLIIRHCDFEYLIDATNSIPNGTFGKLESLKLNNLPKLIKICNGNLRRGIIELQLFGNLVTVEMAYCRAIRNLFPESIANSLVNLECLNISICEMLEEVVSMDAVGNEVTETYTMLEFPKLKKVSMCILSRFKGFTSQSNGGDQTLFNQVNFPNMEELYVDRLDCIVKLLSKEMPITSLHKLTYMFVYGCCELLTIAESDSIRSLQNLESLIVDDCNALKVLFDFKGMEVTNDDAGINMLGRLTSLWLGSLPSLVRITRMVPKGNHVFQNLESLSVDACESLEYLFSPSMNISLVALKFLKVSNCESIVKIIEKEEGSSEIKIVGEMKTRIVFPKMEILQLNDLPSIQRFCSQNYEYDCPSLKDWTIDQCPKMEKFIPRPRSAPERSKSIRKFMSRRPVRGGTSL